MKEKIWEPESVSGRQWFRCAKESTRLSCSDIVRLVTDKHRLQSRLAAADRPEGQTSENISYNMD